MENSSHQRGSGEKCMCPAVLCGLEQSTACQEVCILYVTLPGAGFTSGQDSLSSFCFLFGTEQQCYKSHRPLRMTKYRNQGCENSEL